MISRSNDEEWFHIDEATDVIASLRHFAVCLIALQDDPTAWKWAIISIHSALQGAMTCHLSGTANLGCLSKKSIEEWCEWRQRDMRGEINWIEQPADEFGIPSRRPASNADRAPRTYMATPQTLFTRLSKEKLRFESGCGVVLSVTPDQRRSFKKLNELRNQFAHFTPLGWSIEVSGLPKIFSDIIEIISSIASDPWPFRHLGSDTKSEMDSALHEIFHRLRAYAIMKNGRDLELTAQPPQN